jgi:hypothetical protein
LPQEVKGRRLEWEKNWAAPQTKNETVDVAGLYGRNAIVLIEVELRRANPVSNVAKIWRWIEEKKLRGRILFFHALSKAFDSHPHQRDNAKLIGNKLQDSEKKRVRYIYLKINYSPRKHGKAGGGRRRKAAGKLARRISKELGKLL